MAKKKEAKPKQVKEIDEFKTNIQEVGLFDIIKYLFTDSEKLNSLSDLTLSRNAFMINRYISIMHPLQANILQINKINQNEVVKYWSQFLKIYKGRVPGWVYTKGSKKSTEAQDNKRDVSMTLIKSYCKYYNINIKDVQNALYFYRDEMINEILIFEKTIKKLLDNE